MCALQLSQTLDKGIVASECYIKIAGTDYIKMSSLDEESTGIRVTVVYYYNKAVRDSNSKDYLMQKSYDIADATKEIREDQYVYLKTLDDFDGAIDI